MRHNAQNMIYESNWSMKAAQQCMHLIIYDQLDLRNVKETKQTQINCYRIGSWSHNHVNYSFQK